MLRTRLVLTNASTKPRRCSAHRSSTSLGKTTSSASAWRTSNRGIRVRSLFAQQPPQILQKSHQLLSPDRRALPLSLPPCGGTPSPPPWPERGRVEGHFHLQGCTASLRAR